VMTLQNASQQYGMEPAQFISLYKEQIQSSAEQLGTENTKTATENIAKLEKVVPVVTFLNKVMGDSKMISKDGKYVKNISKEDKAMLEKALDCDVEPDFYIMARNLFHNTLYCVVYLLTFCILWIHLRHAFESVFQTWGLENYTYYPIIKFLAILYAWVICLGFASIPICVWLFL
jgi:hypothetical protein